MALARPITIAEEAIIIQGVLQTWVEQYGGSAAVVSNLRDLWNQASLDSQSPRILICYVGENSRGDFVHMAAWHRVDRIWNIAVTKGRGYYANRGDSLTDGTATELPFYDALENVRDQCRKILNISEEQPSIDYRSIRPIAPTNMALDAYVIEFTTANDIPAIGTTSPNPP